MSRTVWLIAEFYKKKLIEWNPVFIHELVNMIQMKKITDSSGEVKILSNKILKTRCSKMVLTPSGSKWGPPENPLAVKTATVQRAWHCRRILGMLKTK